MHKRFAKITATILSSLSLLGISVVANPTFAENVQVTALIAAKPEDFQLQLTSQPGPGKVGTGQIITFTLTYGSYLSTNTDSIVLIVSWQQTPNSPRILRYVDNSAIPAIQGDQPQVNIDQQTITWHISPVPPGANRQVSWQLQIDPQRQATADTNIAVTASLTGPGVQLVSQPLRFTYHPSAINQPTAPITPWPSSAQPSTTPPAITPTSITTPTPPPGSTPTKAPPSLSNNPTISDLHWLVLLTGMLFTSLLIWIIRRRFLPRLWLIYRRRIIIEGYITWNSQPLLKATVQASSHHTLTNQHGYYRLYVPTGHHLLEVIKDHQLLHQQDLVLDATQLSQTIKLQLDLPSADATIDDETQS